MKFGKAVAKHRVLILILSLVLMIPALLGMMATRINYDMLDYLPQDIDTAVGQNELLNEFGKGAFSFVIVEDMKPKDVAKLKSEIEKVEHVETVLWYDSIADLSVPMELLPDSIYQEFNTDNATMMAIFFDTSTSSDDTMDAIRSIRSIAGRQCFVSGMSALVTDLKDLCEKEEPIYVGIAVILACVAMMLFMDNWIIPFVFLASIGISILLNMGTNYFLGEISYITKALSAVLQLAVTMDYSIFLWHSYNEERPRYEDHSEANGSRYSQDAYFCSRQFDYHDCRIYRAVLYEFYAWPRFGTCDGERRFTRRNRLCYDASVHDLDSRTSRFGKQCIVPYCRRWINSQKALRRLFPHFSPCLSFWRFQRFTVTARQTARFIMTSATACRRTLTM